MSSHYFLLQIIILSVTFYFLTYLLAKTGTLKWSVHTKIWNVLLLITALVTGVLGLLLTIQVNYKLTIPHIHEILTWHVDFGIAMFMISIFHFSWHLKYYFQMLKSGKRGPDLENKAASTEISDKTIKKAIFLLGFSTLFTQTLMIRTFFSIFNGNELVIGILLANWMFLTGLGAWLGRFAPNKANTSGFFAGTMMLIGILPLITVFLLHDLRNIIFPLGGSVGVIQLFFCSLIFLLPFCILSGILFTIFASYHKKITVAKAYSIEVLGSIAGGVLLNFILFLFLDSIRSLALMAVLNIGMASLWFLDKNRTLLVLSLVAALSILVFSWVINPDQLAKRMIYKNQELIDAKDMPLGSLVVTNTSCQMNFYENNLLLFTTNNTTSNEEAVHYAMLQRPEAKNVLLVSGGVSGTTLEILKYNVKFIDYVELNPELVRIGKKFTHSIDNLKINVMEGDARAYIRKSEKKYDVALINVPEPQTAQLNRFYTKEFYHELKEKLSKNGVVSLSLPSTADYVGIEAGMVNSIIYNTLKTSYANVLIVPGERNFFLASDSFLDIEIGKLSQQSGIQNLYVNPYYMDDQSLKERGNDLIHNIQKHTEINTDFFPVAYFRQIAWWMSWYKMNYMMIVAPCLLVLVSIFIFLKPVPLGLFTAGFSAMSLEMLLIFAFQVIVGYVYYAIGMIFTLFMFGMAGGSFFWKHLYKTSSKKNYSLNLLFVALFSFTLPSVLFFLSQPPLFKAAIYLIISLLVVVIAFLTGAAFSMASGFNEENQKKTASSIYAVDMTGSALGALLGATFLFPMLGIAKTCFLIGGLNVISAIVVYVRK
jgi:spermidine synthase